jgi:hypothetical protein
MVKNTTNKGADIPPSTILMREVQTGDETRRTTSRQPEIQDILTDDKNALYAEEGEPYGGDTKEQTLAGEDIGSTEVGKEGSNGLKKWVERRWVWTIYGVMFLAGE